MSPMLTTMAEHGWELVDSELARKDPTEPPIPPIYACRTLAYGGFAKLSFYGGVCSERMWVEVVGREGAFYRGRLSNTPISVSIAHGTELWFEPRHVFGILPPDSDRLPHEGVVHVVAPVHAAASPSPGIEHPTEPTEPTKAKQGFLFRIEERIKEYEARETDRRIHDDLPILARIDGRSFSRFTRGFIKPFDPRLSEIMVRTTAELTQLAAARIGYTQSDEITLAWMPGETFFGRRTMKMASILAAQATVIFNDLLRSHPEISDHARRRPHFDARVWGMPSPEDAAEVFLWREMDAIRNSTLLAGLHAFGKAKMHGLRCTEVRRMLAEHGTPWDAEPEVFQRGAFIRKQVRVRRYTVDEIDELPPRHEARTNPGLEVERTDYLPFRLPTSLRVIANRADVLFFGAEPVEYVVRGPQDDL